MQNGLGLDVRSLHYHPIHDLSTIPVPYLSVVQSDVADTRLEKALLCRSAQSLEYILPANEVFCQA